MASGQTLCRWTAAEFEKVTGASLTDRNGHKVLGFDTAPAAAEYAYFKDIMPQNYAGGGVTVLVHYAAATATSGTVGWLAAFERIGDSQQDIDADGFASDKTVTATTVPGTSGYVDILSVAFANGAEMDSVAVGEAFRLRISRDYANDNAAGDAQLAAVEIRET
jgi:hypothetical protein